MKKIQIFFLTMLLICNTIYSQDNGDISIYKRIPVIRYDPVYFFSTVDDAFIHSPEYLDICLSGKDTLYTQNRYGEVNFYHNDFFERNRINTKLFFRSDSVFILSVKNESASWKGLPIYRIYGIKKGEEYRFGLTEGNGELYPFTDFLKIRYGSIAKFQEVYLSYISNRLKLMGDKYNGISLYPQDKASMESFLKEDYLIHEKYNPTDTLNVLNRFMSLVSSYTLLKDRQEELLRVNLLKNIRREPRTYAKKRELSEYVYHEFVIYGLEVSSVLSAVLTKQQYDEVKWGLMKYNEHRVESVVSLQLYRTPKSLTDDYSMQSYEQMLKETADILLKNR